MNKKVELLMPAGNLEAFYQALYNGADAIYLGMRQFSARASSHNFSREDYLEAIKVAHRANVLIYVTINTLLDTDEFNEALELIDFLYLNDVDAIIIQDLGLLEVAPIRYPQLDLHVSTQMFIHNLEGIAFLKQCQVTRIVVARETPIELIKEMTKQGIEIEVFVYGALCTSYSGQCFFSSATKERSANKGRCAQLCRLPYDLYDGQKKLSNGYLLSLKDLNLLEHIDDLIAANIASFKVEGRMKRSEYVGYVTRVFRDTIDDLQDGKQSIKQDDTTMALKKLFNRGFTKGYVYNQDEVFNHYRPNHLGIPLGKITRVKPNKIEIKLLYDLNQHDGIRIISQKEDFGLVANKIYKQGLLVNHADKGDIIELDFHELVSVNDSIVLTSDVKQLDEISRYTQAYYRMRRIEVDVLIEAHKPIKIKAIDGEHMYIVLGDEITQTALKAPISTEKVISQLTKVDKQPYFFDLTIKQDDNLFISINQLTALKRSLMNLIELGKAHSHYKRAIQTYQPVLDSIPLTSHCYVEINQASQQSLKKGDVYLTFNPSLKKEGVQMGLPLVYEKRPNINSPFIQSLSDLWNNPSENKVGLSSLNVTNPYALAFLYRQGLKLVFVSNELDTNQIKQLSTSFENLYHFKPNIGIWRYGRRNMMTMKYCVIKSILKTNESCQACHHNTYYLSHHHRRFPLSSDGYCHSIILEDKAFKNDDSYLDGINEYYRYTLE